MDYVDEWVFGFHELNVKEWDWVVIFGPFGEFYIGIDGNEMVEENRDSV